MPEPAGSDRLAESVGLVVVSHSRPLARAAVELALQMASGSPVRVAIAAGLEEGELGTDAVAISEAIEAVAGPAGVVVLMDLGSALLSAELALELVGDEVREQVTLSPAPLVEGLVAAVVTAAGGGTRAEVAAEAADGLAAKSAQLAPAPADAVNSPKTVRGRFVVTDPQGLHARPAAALVTALRGLGVPVTLRNLTTGAGPVPGGSLTRVARLGALAGHEVEVSAEGGPELQAAVDHLLTVAGRPAAEGPAAGRLVAGVSRGGSATVAGPLLAGPLPAAPGVAVGPVRAGSAAAGRAGSPADVGGARRAGLAAELGGAGRAGSEAEVRGAGSAGLAAELGNAGSAADMGGGGSAGAVAEAGGARAAAAQGERERLDAAVAAVRAEVAAIRHKVIDEIGPAEGGIFDAHLLLLDDPELQAATAAALEAGATAEDAWSAALDQAQAEWAALADPYLRARADDLAALRDQVLANLAARPDSPEPGDGGAGVLVVGDLTPAQAVALDPAQVTGVVLAYGSPTAHSVILLRARGIPAVVAAGPGVLAVAPGTLVALDGTTGELTFDPDEATRNGFEARRDADRARAARARAAAGEPAVTRDGVRVAIGANLGSAADARAAMQSGAELAGLVRTEFLFLGRAAAPDEDEQLAAYLELAEALGGRRLTLRTLDAGGDKPLPYLDVPVGANPFLGVRGLRLSLLRPSLFAAQLRAMVRAAHETPVTVLFPMVSTVAELTAAREALDTAIRAVGRGRPDGLRVGAMIEVPAAALKAAALAPLVDEFSIGTNDLTQYTLAAARGDEGVAALGDPWDPGVLQLVHGVCRAGVPTAVCGEFAADPHAAAALLGLGVRELSVTPTAIPATKEAVRAVDITIAEVLAREALDQPDSAHARTTIGRALRPPPTE